MPEISGTDKQHNLTIYSIPVYKYYKTHTCRL